MRESGNMPGYSADTPADMLLLALPRSQKVVLVMDLVESVRLMAANEAGTIGRWRLFIGQASVHVLPQHRGRLVKSLGDGLLAEFEDPREAVQASLTLHRLLGKGNDGHPQDQHMVLRGGINSSHIYTDQLDIYGSGVNLAARLATLAGPGETVVSSSVRDALTDGLDASIEDLGDCYLKHIEQPVRAWRIAEAGRLPPTQAPRADHASLQPVIAVIPFASRAIEAEHLAVGDMIADGVIARLGKARGVQLISRLSTGAFRDRSTGPEQIHAHLGAQYAVCGSYALLDQRVAVTVELVNTPSGRLMWTDRLALPLADLFAPQSELCFTIAERVHAAIMDAELHQASTQPLPTLRSYSLLLGAVSLMHRASFREFDHARLMLERLMEMHNRHAIPCAWMAKWYVLKAAQGWSADPAKDAAMALASCERALENDPRSALALAVTGQVHGYLRKDLDAAERLYRQALANDPHESLAWLWLGMNSGFKGESEQAADATEKALALSPLDPLRYYYESLAASAAVAAGRYERTITLAENSLRLNQTHSSTYRALAIAQALSGRQVEARRTVSRLLLLEPEFTVSRFLQRMPGASAAPAYARTLAEALRSAGLPD